MNESCHVEESLYERLEPITDFAAQAFEGVYYVAPPDDWYVVVADIASSTNAVNEGRYTDVNYVGAACVAAVRNKVVRSEIASAFGGDGATFVVSCAVLDPVIDALISTLFWARESFDLDLRVGAVAVGDLRSRGAQLTLAKLELSPGNYMAMFRGDALNLADALIKAPDSPYRQTPEGRRPPEPDLRSLSCRWAPLLPIRGVIYCLIVGLAPRKVGLPAGCSSGLYPGDRDANDDGARTRFADKTYKKVMHRLAQVAGISHRNLNPVRVQGLQFAPDLRKMHREVLACRYSRCYAWLRVLVINVLGRLMFATGFSVGGLTPARYKHEMAVNSDFQKVSGELKLVVDISAQQANEIDAYLEVLFREGEIVFGSYRAREAVMTCIASNPADNEHVHYVDGSEGGLWRAAEAMKRRRSDALANHQKKIHLQHG